MKKRFLSVTALLTLLSISSCGVVASSSTSSDDSSATSSDVVSSSTSSESKESSLSVTSSESSSEVSSEVSSEASSESSSEESSSVHVHEYGAWTAVSEPTLDAGGSYERSCECGEKETVEVPNLLDTSVWSKDEGQHVEPTHEADGKDVYTSVYGSVTVVLPKGEHEFGEWSLVNMPTLESAGSAIRYCEADGASDTTEVPALSDDTVWSLVADSHVEPTCSEPGSDTYTSIYGSVTVEIPSVGHSASSTATVVETENTVSLVKTCSSCGEVVSTVKEIAKVAGAAYSIGESSDFTYNEAEGKYVSKAIGNSSSTHLYIEITEAGPFEFEWTVSSEAGYDFLKIWKNDEPIEEKSGERSGTYSCEAAAGDTFHFQYGKDPSTTGGKDQATVKFLTGAKTYHAMNYNSMGGSEVDPSFIINGVIDGALPQPTKVGLLFDGWYLDEELTTKYENQTFSSDSVLYAKWIEPVVVTFDVGGGNPLDPLYVKPGTVPSLPTPVRDGYVFVGWYTDAEFTTEYIPVELDANITIFAKWLSNDECSMFYGSYTGFKFYKYSSYYEEDDYGWGSSYSSSGTYTANNTYVEFSVDVTGAFRLRTAYAQYIEGTLGAYDPETGLVASDSTRFIKYDAADDILVVASTSTLSSSTYFYVLSKGTVSHVSNSYFSSGNYGFVTYNVGEATKSLFVDIAASRLEFDVQFYKSNNEQLFASGLTATTVLSFDVRRGDEEVASFATSPSGTLSSEVDAYRGSYTSADGETLELSGAGDAIFSEIGSASRVSYEEISEGVIYVYNSAIYRFEITLDMENRTFTYAERNVTLILDYGYEDENGERVTSSHEIKYNSYTSIPVSAPTRDGYVFDGWYRDAEFTSKVTGTIAITTTTTLYAKWIEQFTVEFRNVADESIASTMTVNDGATISSLPTPEAAEGTFFEGWYYDKEFTTEFTSDSVVTGNTVLYAKFSNALVVTLHKNNGEDASTMYAQVNRPVSIPVPVYAGHAFEGWYTTATFDEGTEFDPSQPLTENVELYAKWGDAHALTGEYLGFNLYGGYLKNNQKSLTPSYAITVGADGSVSNTRHSTQLNGSMITSYQDGVVTFTKGGSNYYGYAATSASGIKYFTYAYGASSLSDPIYADMAFAISFPGDAGTIKATTLGHSSSTLEEAVVQIVVNDVEEVVFVDAVNDLLITDVTVETSAGGGFSTIAASDGTLCDTVTISKDGEVIASYVKEGTDLIRQ